MKASLRLIVALIVFGAFTFNQNTCAAELELTSISLLGDGRVRLTLATNSSETIHVQGSSQFNSWNEITSAVPDAQNSITFTDAATTNSARFYRVYSGGNTNPNVFVATVQAYGSAPLTNATVTVASNGHTFKTDASGQAQIPISELTFESGFRLTASATNYESVTIDLPPALYAYTFTLTRTPLAPAAIVSRTYNLGTNTITLYDSGMFRLSNAAGSTIGDYRASRSTTIDDTWSIQAATPYGLAEISLTFDSATSGHFTQNGPTATTSGQFSEGTTTGTPPGNPIAAPASLSTVRFITMQSPLGPRLDFTITLSGQTNGTFIVMGDFTGNGTFTYNTTPTGAHLRLDYLGDFQGDYDDFELTFIEGAGLGTKANSFEGPMGAEGMVGPASGTFSYQ